MAPLRIVTLIALFSGLWLLWSGHFHDPLPLVFGAVSVALVLWLGARMGTLDEEGYPFSMALGILAYLPWIVGQIFKSNLEVARIILDPKLPIAPSIFYLKTTQRSEIARAIHANSITVTPGTISLDLRGDQILVHALTSVHEEQDASGGMDARVTRLEGQA